ncbi:MAG: hypothetical protein LZF60_250160 [Nitrospira sp.]|nr:MAG: hypothetical protein LZF60_250160 [Nitrospira sp.]
MSYTLFIKISWLHVPTSLGRNCTHEQKTATLTLQDFPHLHVLGSERLLRYGATALLRTETV